jgi:ABC-type nitrate/sulfonate/bicarbonate transport system substrate-binding protein
MKAGRIHYFGPPHAIVNDEKSSHRAELEKARDLKPKTLAIMHGSSFTGDCA